MHPTKTNAMRMLDRAGIQYGKLSYDYGDGSIHGAAVAEKINRPPETVFKTLVAHSGNSLFVFIIPVAEELDLKKAAKAAGEKKLDMLPVKELQKWTGYIRGGCSPIGMKKLYPTFIDSSAGSLETMIVSAGKIGTQIEVAPPQLAGLTAARFVELLQ